eukprot:scaffold5448_cov113-Isochrysis_galbana.AAC.1
MQDPPRVHMLHCARQLGHPSHHRAQGEVQPTRAVGGEHVGKGAPRGVLHDNCENMLVHEGVDVRDDTPVLQRLQDLHLVLQLLRICCTFCQRDLLGDDILVGRRVAQEHGTAMLAASQHAEPLVLGEREHMLRAGQREAGVGMARDVGWFFIFIRDVALIIACATKIETLLTSGDSAGHPVPDDTSALTPLPHYLPIPFPYSGRFSGGMGMVQKLRARMHYNSATA